MSPFNAPLTEGMQKVAQVLEEERLVTWTKWNTVYCCPPLIIDEEGIMEGINILDKALTEADKYVEG